ncbi:hypothetical protein Tco_1398778, partial [Tanacetum coccineum]
MSFSTGVIPNTSVNHLEDRVMSNNSQGKKQEVEDQRRKFNVVESVPSTTGSTAPVSQPTQATHPMVTR